MTQLLDLHEGAAAIEGLRGRPLPDGEETEMGTELAAELEAKGK